MLVDSPQIALFMGTAGGAVALLMLMPGTPRKLRAIGALLGAAALASTWFLLHRFITDLGAMTTTAFSYYYVFSAISIISAVRVITHKQPVYSALWFIMTVLATAGLFLVLAAEFMAVALLIIYAGAILVTYMFVIMLASQSQGKTTSSDTHAQYDRLAREPLAAILAGFVLLAVLLSVAFEPMQPQPTAAAEPDAALLANVLADRPVRPEPNPAMPVTPEQARISNAERLGVDLFREHPLGIELAGVILLVALIGAVVIARTQIPEETRIQRSADATGATAQPTYEPGPDDPQSIGQTGGRMGA